MSAPLLGTNGSLGFTAGDYEPVTAPVAKHRADHTAETLLIKDLLARFKSRREQVGEWMRLTGKCRRTFEHRLFRDHAGTVGGADA
ncbi:MAG TPA: hypothetical protein VHX65_06880 [Pirellulales bacterium]|nr:hypothetical protein [Pirellulales bacterium]